MGCIWRCWWRWPKSLWGCSPSSLKDQPHPGLYQQECSQQVMGSDYSPSVRHLWDHIWTLSPVSGSPVQGRHWCTGVCPAEATEMVRGWSTWWIRRGCRKLVCSVRRKEGKGRRILPNRRVQRRQRQVFSEVHNERPRCNGHKLEQGKFYLDIKPFLYKDWSNAVNRHRGMMESPFLEITPTRHGLTRCSDWTCFGQVVD